MNKRIFWKLIDSSVRKFPGYSVKAAQMRAKWLVDQLAVLAEEELVVFDAIWDSWRYLCRSEHLGSIVQQVSRYWNDDIYYEEFPNWLILQGSRFFRRVYEKPISLPLKVGEKASISLWVRVAEAAYQKQKNDKDASLEDLGTGDYDLEHDVFRPENEMYGKHTPLVKEIRGLVIEHLMVYKNEAADRSEDLMRKIGRLLDNK